MRRNSARPVHTTRREENSLTSVLASPALATLITYFIVHPHTEVHFQALKRATGLANRSLQLELHWMQRMQLLTRRDAGGYTYYMAAATSGRWHALRPFVRHFAHPADIIRAALTDIPGIDAAFVFGSTVTNETREDSNVDVFVVGDTVDRNRLAGELLAISVLLDREVNVVYYTWTRLTARWNQGAGFVHTVLRGMKAWVVGDETTLGAYA